MTGAGWSHCFSLVEAMASLTHLGECHILGGRRSQFKDFSSRLMI